MRSEGAAWRHPKRPGRSGKQEVAGAASALATEQLRGEGEEDDREEEVGWAGQLRWAARWARMPGKLQVSALFYFLFVLFFLNLFCHCFEFKIIKTMPKTPLNIFVLLDGLFQKLIKYFRGI